jgi:drug/metabolite transporter (DMT)-like permease
VPAATVANLSLAPCLWMLGASFAFAWMGQFASLLRDDCDWRVVALARSSLALLFALAAARLAGARLVFRRPGAIWLRGAASSLSLLCTFFALAQLPSSEVLTLTNTFPIWVALLSWPVLRVRPARSVWMAAVCGVVGVALIQSPHFQGDPKGALAAALAVLAALANAIAMLGLHRLKDLDAWAIVVHYSGVATAVVLLPWLAGPTPDLPALGDATTALLLLGVGCAATAGQVCVTRAFTEGTPAPVSVVGLMVVVFSLSLDVLFHGPSVCPVTLAGIALVVAPTAWVMLVRPAEGSAGGAARPSPVHG